MPSIQPQPPTETEKGTGILGFPFFNSLSDFAARACLGLATLRGRAGDMNKPMNVGAPRPINTLSNNSTSSRTPLSLVPSSRPILSSSPPAKRQKLDESSSNPTHTSATFTVIDPVSPRRRSIGSVSVPDSQRSVASNASASQRSVPEYRNLDLHTKHKRKRSRTNRVGSIFLGQEDVESPRSKPTHAPKVDEDITDDEVHLVEPPKAPEVPHQLKRKEIGQRPISEYASRFIGTESDPRTRFSKVVDKVEKKTMKFGEADLSPDELTSNLEEVGEGRPAKRHKPTSSSLSKRGNISATKFTSASTAKSSSQMEKACQLQDDNKRNAGMIIGTGLRVLRGASGRCMYQAGYKDDPDPLSLSILEIGHTLFPIDKEKNILAPYKYLTINLKDVKCFLRVGNEEESCIVSVIFKSANFTNGAGPKLMVEFASKPEFSRFFQWVATYRNTFEKIDIKDCKRVKLEHDLRELMERAQSHIIITDEEAGALTPDDIRVMQHNHNGRVPVTKMNPGVTNESKTRPKVRDAMNSSPTARLRGDNIASSPLWNDRLASAPRQTRTTRSKFAFLDSPEPGESEPEGWTSLHPGWEKQWRNSLVYPDTGKNRATVDKDDIQRLDEGQFLNDNIIIFYLRYLQKNLEDTNKDLAKRIFFQNTFFYDKLKPTKTGQGINYDSVKTWTSRVDLFSKDFIIVPINEYAHWYVAIIYNAPSLLRASASHEQIDGNKNVLLGTTSPNLAATGVEVNREPSEAPSQNGVPSSSISGDNMAAPTQEDVVENMRRMSIDSSNQPNHEAKLNTENSAEKGAGLTPTGNGHKVYEVNDADKAEVEVEHIPTTNISQTRKKIGKRSSVGPQKYDPNQLRIITLDSLGASHSPTCRYLKQYLIAELRDKKEIEIPASRAMGHTAKDIPEQTNHCDCGLFLLGYIQQFLLDPDAFVKSVLQRDGKIPWSLDPSALRNNIRDLIFKLQKEQQDRENVALEQKRQARMSKPMMKGNEDQSHTTNLSNTPLTSEPIIESTSAEKAGGSKSPSAPLTSRPPSLKGSSPILGEALDPSVSDRNPNDAISKEQMSAPSAQNDDSRNTQRGETVDCSDVEKTQTKPRSDQHVAALPRKTEPASSHKTHHDVPGTSSSSPIRGRVAKCCSLSPMAESVQIENNFVPLLSESPSSKGSRGATPLDPVVVDDLDSNKRGNALQSPQRPSGNPQRRQLIVEIPSIKIHGRSPGSKTDGRKQTEHRSPHFANRQDGEKMTAAKLRDRPQNDVIDLSDD
ncbi:hypothetical protein FHL15_002904 [Xylaria flabelliformis]|uniref:Ubiquitin-like protease family profile domain-containing protein n=1 Tax=Xylaria flabelliformis TaxID=2512241 RepID=A0A553I7J9_9PEZI|nr:hypothetical protein FHL15_002904 [Xylaria flabelliformis]